MYPVQKSDAAEINIERLVVAVMFSCRAMEKVIAAVHRRRLEELPSKERPHGQYVGV